MSTGPMKFRVNSFGRSQMSVRKRPGFVLNVAWLAVIVMYAAGCGNSPSEKVNANQPAWTPEPDSVAQLKQVGEVGDYQLSLPLDFTPVEAPGNGPGNMK